ncbi:hypothetical protein D7X33_41940 [Butyricicoccus sp. 1XD8-22]|nr:hypothetical protein D7X33_41940 [Butyricicoccus sp. 1XD8-22]
MLFYCKKYPNGYFYKSKVQFKQGQAEVTDPKIAKELAQHDYVTFDEEEFNKLTKPTRKTTKKNEE